MLIKHKINFKVVHISEHGLLLANSNSLDNTSPGQNRPEPILRNGLNQGRAFCAAFPFLYIFCSFFEQWCIYRGDGLFFCISLFCFLPFAFHFHSSIKQSLFRHLYPLQVERCSCLKCHVHSYLNLICQTWLHLNKSPPRLGLLFGCI